MDQEKFGKVVELITKQLELKNEFSKKFVAETLKSIMRFDEQHTMKGLGEYAEWGAVGVAMKTEKQFNIIKDWYSKGTKATDSIVIDAEWQDLSVYALMGKLVQNNEWYE